MKHSSTLIHPNTLPKALRKALENPESSIELSYIRQDRVVYAELHPDEVPTLRDRVTFLVVGEGMQQFSVWRDDTASGLQRMTADLTREEALTEMNRLAVSWPERVDIMDEDELRAYIVENECAGHRFYDSLESAVGAVRSSGSGGDFWMSFRLWATTETESGWALWAVEDTDSKIHLVGVFNTEAEAKSAAEKASNNASRSWDLWLLELAQAEFDQAKASGSLKLAGDMHLAITHLRSCLKEA